jgi:TRAP-type uncharacterized transport system fused permease subunit
LLQAAWPDVLWAVAVAAVSLACFAAAACGWIRTEANLFERVGMTIIGILLIDGSLPTLAGAAVGLVAIVGAHVLRTRRSV